MSKNKEVATALNDIMGTPPPEKAIERIQKGKYDNQHSTVIAIRFRINDKKILDKHFKLKGYMSTSQAVREIIYKYMQNNGLI